MGVCSSILLLVHSVYEYGCLMCSWVRMGGRNSVGVRVYRYVFASCMEGRA